MAKKKVQVILNTVKEEEKTLWQKIKDKFYNSGNIAWNWFLSSIGAIGTAAIGIFANIDWSTPMNILRSGTQFTKEQWMLVGLGTFVAGVVGYATRVSGTKEVEGRLLPKAD